MYQFSGVENPTVNSNAKTQAKGYFLYWPLSYGGAPFCLCLYFVLAEVYNPKMSKLMHFLLKLIVVWSIDVIYDLFKIR